MASFCWHGFWSRRIAKKYEKKSNSSSEKHIGCLLWISSAADDTAWTGTQRRPLQPHIEMQRDRPPTTRLSPRLVRRRLRRSTRPWCLTLLVGVPRGLSSLEPTVTRVTTAVQRCGGIGLPGWSGSDLQGGRAEFQTGLAITSSTHRMHNGCNPTRQSRNPTYAPWKGTFVNWCEDACDHILQVTKPSTATMAARPADMYELKQLKRI